MFRYCKLSVLCAFVLIAVVMFSTGCSNSNSNSKLKNYGRIKLIYENIPDDVQSMYISLFNGAGTCIWGPKQVSMSEYPESVMLYGVNVRCKSLALGCYDKEASSVKYFHSEPIAMEPNTTVEITDPKFTPADQVELRSYDLDVGQLRGHTGDTIRFENIVSAGTDAEHYWMDLSEYSTWSVSTDNRLASVDKSDKKLAKGQYRCLTTVDSAVPVNCTLGKYTSAGTVDITEATVTDTGLFATMPDAETFTNEVTDVLKVPTGAEYRYLYMMAKWSDGKLSMCNTSASWSNDETKAELAANHGRLKGYFVDAEAEDDEEIEDDGVVKIEAAYTSNGKEYKEKSTVKIVSANLTGLKTNPTTVKVAKGIEFYILPLGIYGSEIEVELDPEAFTSSSSVPACVEANAEYAYKFTAKDVGTSVLKFVEKVKSYSADCAVTVE